MAKKREIGELYSLLSQAGELGPERKQSLADLLTPKRAPRHPMLLVRSELATAAAVGDLILDVDREARRAAAFLEKVDIARPFDYRKRDGFPSPSKTARGTLVLRSAKPGSAELYLWMVGNIAQVLLSDPVQLALTVHWFLERIPKRWSARRQKDFAEPVERIADRVMRSADRAIRRGAATRVRIKYSADGDFELEFETIPTRG